MIDGLGIVRALITLVQELQRMSLKTYPGENVKQCMTNIFDKCSHLDMAGVLPSNDDLQNSLSLFCGRFLNFVYDEMT